MDARLEATAAPERVAATQELDGEGHVLVELRRLLPDKRQVGMLLSEPTREEKPNKRMNELAGKFRSDIRERGISKKELEAVIRKTKKQDI